MRGAIVCCATFSLLLGLTGCSNAIKVERGFSMNADWNAYDSVLIESRNGGVSLVADLSPEVRIDGKMHAYGRTVGDARAVLDQLEISAGPHQDDARTLLIRFEAPEDLSGRSAGARIDVHVPQAVAARVRTTNGSVNVRNMNQTDVYTANGRVEAAQIRGELSVTTSNGAVVARDIEGPCKLRTSNGAIRALAIAGAVEATTSNGGITLRAAPGAGAPIILTGSNGGIDAELPVTLAADVSLETSNGRVYFDAPPGVLESVDQTRWRLEGRLNGGGEGRVVASTSNGSVRVRCVE